MINALNVEDKLQLSASAATATQAVNIDTKNADWCTIRIVHGAAANTNGVGATLGLLQSDDTVVTNFATFNSNFARTEAAGSHVVRYEVDARARKRYLRLTGTPGTSSNDGVALTVLSSLTRNASEPASTTDMVATTNDIVVIG